MKNGFDYRLKITDVLGNVTYFVRCGCRTSYMTGAETPIALANLLSQAAAETRFALEDVTDGMAAEAVMRKALAEKAPKTKVERLS